MDSSKLIENTADFRSRIIRWYDANKRDLPWRREPSLYKTVVSEFMLQQTQVKTVLPYFKNWLSTFPDFESLAKSSEDRVLKAWEGLGYYSRARNLQKLSRALVAMDAIPRDAKDWLALPGIGPYSAAAICSIAFSDASAVVDGNVVRILSRLAGDPTEYPSSAEAAKAYKPLADSLLNVGRPGDHNQAMMELGATICHKRAPQCLICPVQLFCQARIEGIEANIPRFKKTKWEKRIVDRAWISGPKGILLHRIPDTASRMKGLHEIPTLEQLGIALPAEQPEIERKRSITRFRITERFHRLDARSLDSQLPSSEFLWTSVEALEDLPLSGPHRKWIDELINTYPPLSS